MAFIKNHSFSQRSDEHLLAGYKSSADMVALSELFQRYMDLIYGVCLKYLEDKELAKDAVLDIFEELVPKLQKHEVANFKAWVYQLSKKPLPYENKGSKEVQQNFLRTGTYAKPGFAASG